jgi:hypothetical protein
MKSRCAPGLACLNGCFFDPIAFRRAIATFGAIGRRPIELYKLGIVHIGSERHFDRIKIGFVTIAC